MSEAQATKFNLPKTTTYIFMPLAFMGKNDKRFAGLTNACQFLLAEIYTRNSAINAPAKLTYDDFVEKFGMSRATVRNSLAELIERKFIERVGISRYRFLTKFNKDDYIVIDDYLHKKLWDVGGKQKRLARSRIKTLAFLQREDSPNNPNTRGVFKSSQARIGTAINLPKTTAGESVRELVKAGLVHVQSVGGLHCLTRYTVDVEFKYVKHYEPQPSQDELEAVKTLFKSGGERAQRSELTQLSELMPVDGFGAERRAEERQRQFMNDKTYAELVGRLEKLKDKHITAILKHDGQAQAQAEKELEDVGERLRAYLKAHNVHDVFPKGFFYIF